MKSKNRTILINTKIQKDFKVKLVESNENKG